MLPELVREHVEEALGAPITAVFDLSGGCIAHATSIEAAGARYFLKWSDGAAAETFQAEAVGLQALSRAAERLDVPEVISLRTPSNDAWGVLLTEWVEEGKGGSDFWSSFGDALASLHRTEGEGYGFETDNFIGRLPQYNGWRDSWPVFFVEMRLEPQAEMARRNGRWKRTWDRYLAQLVERRDSLLPEAPPRSILHGDLWNGNFLTGSSGRAALIDPAVYFGHRETDLAMSELFGGFDARFYDSYRSSWPLEPGYPDRREVYNLYHMINHLNHFGTSYASAVERILKRFA